MKLLLLVFLALAGVASAEDAPSWAMTVERGVLLHQPRDAYLRYYPYDHPYARYASVVAYEGIVDQFSAVVEPGVCTGAGWYGILGLLRRTAWTDHFDTDKNEYKKGTFSQVYFGGGIRYRVAFGEKWAGVGMLGITYTGGQNLEQFPRHHLYHLGLRLEYILTPSWAGTFGYHHLSNGYQFHLPGGERPNGGIDRLSLGLQYRF